MFIRTASGLKIKHIFHDRVIVWVEGITDRVFYKILLDDIDCRIDVYGGKENLEVLLNDKRNSNLPYVIIADGDYDVLMSENENEHLIKIRRHSHENYLFEKIIFKKICSEYISCNDEDVRMENEFEDVVKEMRKKLWKLLAVDIACSKTKSHECVFPDKAETIMNRRGKIRFDINRIKEILNNSKIEKYKIIKEEEVLTKYLENREIYHVIKGHFILSVSRRLFYRIVKKNMGRNPSLDNKTLRMMMSRLTWECVPTRDHRELRVEIRKKVRKCIELAEFEVA